MTERTTVRLPDELIAQAKRKAAAEGRTLTALIEEGLRRVVAEKRDPAKPRDVTIPVSTAKGWLKRPFKTLREAVEWEEEEHDRRKLGR
jgi:hypothetical protein